MSFATPAMGNSNHELERRLADLERNLGEFDRVWVTVGIPGGGGARQQMEVIARRGSPDAAGASHQWAVSEAASDEINVEGGKVSTQGFFDNPKDVEEKEGLKVAESGHAILTVTRDSSSRELVTAVISYADGALPQSDYNSQIIPLAKVTVEIVDGKPVIEDILQLKFEELHIFEDLAVVNGEFQLADLLIAGRNIYEPPPP